MQLTIIILLSVAILVIVMNPFKTTEYVKVAIDSTAINAEIADTALKRAKGLMGIKYLKEDEGMLFVFKTEGYHGFWMFNMSIPIDIIFIGKNKTVVDILQNVQPCGLTCESYSPKEKAMYVLEVKANFIEKRSVKIGSKVDFNLS